MRKPTSTTSTSTTPCCAKVGLKRGPWTPEEDEILSNYINTEGEGRWRTLPKRAGLLRCGKSCRLRWMNYLRPSVKRGQIAPDEEDLILRLHRLLGNRWSLIAGRIPGRTDNEIKNYWNTHLSKKLINQGIDPRTHKPLPTNTTMDQLLVSSATPSATTQTAKNIDVVNTSNLPSASRRISAANPINTASSATAGLEHVVSESQQLVPNYVDDDVAVDDHFQVMMGNNVSLQHLVGPGNNNFMNLCSSSNNNINNNGDNQDQHDDEINYSCSGGEDVFSSFLNSLINEDDVFINNGTGHLLQHPNNHLLPAALSGMIAPPSAESVDAFGFASGNVSGWELETAAAFMSSSGNKAVYGERFTSKHDNQRQS
ncbi:unnamed protein product [Rhodiola kirilowii]